MFLPFLLSHLTPDDTWTPRLGVGPRHPHQPHAPLPRHLAGTWRLTQGHTLSRHFQSQS